MSKKVEQLAVNSCFGGNGDVWMRLVSFYAFAKLLPKYRFKIYVPKFIYSLAEYTFGDRLIIATGDVVENDCLTYTTLGIRHLLKPILKGKRFIAPYQRAVIHDKKKRQLKDFINAAIFNLTDLLGIVQVPEKKYITSYQGYLDVIGIKKIRSVSYEVYVNQLVDDSSLIKERLRGNIPISPELTIPEGFAENVVFFPTGTSRQFVPVWWAVKYMPKAYYAFFINDEDAKEFKEAGLNIVYFYKEPGDIIYLSYQAKWTYSTDSFPSHLLQFATADCTIALTEVLRSRIISPSFKGKFADSLAPCHPCLHMARKLQPLCAAGFTECLNWKNEVYTDTILKSGKS